MSYNGFTTKAKMNSRKEMAEFLVNHFRYSTMNSWNGSTSYANNIKIYNLGISDKEITDKLYEMLDVNDGQLQEEFEMLISDFETETGYTAGWNGRSGGYLVMYEFEWKTTEWKSFCTACGQRNYKTVEETENCRCGRCGKETRVNYKIVPKQKSVWCGRSIDDCTLEEFMDKEEWSIEELKERVKLVQRFDTLCNDIVGTAINYATEFDVVEEEIQVPKTIKVLKEKG